MSARKLQVLVVDDDPAITRLVCELIQRRLADQATVVGLTDAIHACRWLDEHLCDVLLSDIEMSETDGLEILRHAKRRNAWTQVIFMTAYSTWDRISEAIESGASDYLLKPLDPNEVVSLLKQQYARFNRWQVAVRETLKRRTAAALS